VSQFILDARARPGSKGIICLAVLSHEVSPVPHGVILYQGLPRLVIKLSLFSDGILRRREAEKPVFTVERQFTITLPTKSSPPPLGQSHREEATFHFERQQVVILPASIRP
jgi:hypothetical protein